MAINAADQPEPGRNLTAGQYGGAKAPKAQEIVEETNKQKELRFKASHTLFICFLLWILCVHLDAPSYLHD